MMSLEQAIEQYEQYANVCEHHGLTTSQEEFEQMTAWLRELQERRKAPEIIRCKDCKYNANSHKCLNQDSFFLIPKDEDFCSYAKRRTDG